MRAPATAFAMALLAVGPTAAAPLHPAVRQTAARAAAPAVRDWSLVATRLPGGTFLQGNPRAKVKLVEYLSLTCPHCAHMEEVAVPPLTRDYIRTGRVSYEVRAALRDPLDLTAMTLARCAGPARFFAVMPPLYAAQETWIGKAQAAVENLPPQEGRSSADTMRMLARASGLDAFFAAHGIAAARQAACLGDEKEAALLSKMAADIWKPDFPGTPTYDINGVRAGALTSWDALKAKLVAAGA